jgi:hypothetical protein
VTSPRDENCPRRGLVQFSSLGDVTSIPCEKDDRAVISSTRSQLSVRCFAWAPLLVHPLREAHVHFKKNIFENINHRCTRIILSSKFEIQTQNLKKNRESAAFVDTTGSSTMRRGESISAQDAACVVNRSSPNETPAFT